MSRFKRFAHSLASGYVLLAANMLFTLASVPLALKYLGTEEFGLWGLATKIGGFIALVDFGLSASVARILIDHKDDRASGGYGGIVKTGLLVGLVQGALVLGVGVTLACFMGPWLEVDIQYQPALKWLLIGQCALMAISFATRIFNHLLTAHQRFDISNYAQALLFLPTIGILWFCFAHGQGVFSILWAYAATTFPAVAVNWIGCVRLKLLPRRGEWGAITWTGFKRVFAFGSDIFIFALGAQLITASQTLLLTRLIGLEAVTVWSVYTRIFDVLLQVIYRIFDYSSSALAEMIVRGEQARLALRFRQILSLSASLSVVAGTLFAVCNYPFVQLWTSRRFEASGLRPSDIKSSSLLAQRLQSPRDPAAQLIWRQFAPAAREEITWWAADPKAKENLQTVLASELNRLMAGEWLATDTNFGRWATTGEARTTAGPADAPLARAWVNRHHLEDVFPKEIADSRKMRWPPWNDALLAVWLVLCVSLHAHTGLVGQAKAFGFMRYLFFLEGLTFVGLTILFHRYGGITAMLGVSVACSLMFSVAYGLRRTRRYFNLKPRELVAWHRSASKLALRLLPAAIAIWWLTRNLPELWRLILNGTLVGLLATWFLLRHGLDEHLQSRLLDSSPKWLKALLVRLGVKSPV